MFFKYRLCLVVAAVALAVGGSMGGVPAAPATMSSVFRTILTTEGVAGLYRGITPNFMKVLSFPHNTATRGNGTFWNAGGAGRVHLLRRLRALPSSARRYHDVMVGRMCVRFPKFLQTRSKFVQPLFFRLVHFSCSIFFAFFLSLSLPLYVFLL